LQQYSPGRHPLPALHLGAGIGERDRTQEQQAAQAAWEVTKGLENKPQMLPSISHLNSPEIQAAIVKDGADHLEYQPDFVAETADTRYMLEAKASNQMHDPIVLAKKEVAVKWCGNATEYTQSHGGKPWRYVLIPHDELDANMSLNGLAKKYGS